jgi:hypothetical protein
MSRLALGLALGLLAAGAGAQERPVFDTPPPAELPDLSGWESTGASIDLEDPARTLEYELRVQPGREGIWGVTRYRIRFADAAAPAREPGERLQWSDAGRFRRFACIPSSDAAGIAAGACEWRELPEGSPEYQAELPSVLLVWRMHRRLLHARARSLLPHPD